MSRVVGGQGSKTFSRLNHYRLVTGVAVPRTEPQDGGLDTVVKLGANSALDMYAAFCVAHRAERSGEHKGVWVALQRLGKGGVRFHVDVTPRAVDILPFDRRGQLNPAVFDTICVVRNSHGS